MQGLKNSFEAIKNYIEKLMGDAVRATDEIDVSNLESRTADVIGKWTPTKLDEILDRAVTWETGDGEDAEGVIPLDADILGGKWTTPMLDELNGNLAELKTVKEESTEKNTLTSQKVGNVVSFSGYLWTGTSTAKQSVITTVPHKAVAVTMLGAIELTKQAYPVQVTVDESGNLKTGDQALPAGTWGIIGNYMTEDN